MSPPPSDPDPGTPLAVVLRLLAADAPRRVMGTPEDWPRWAALLPHVLAATGHFKPLPGPQDQPGRQDDSWLLDRAATYLKVRARLAEARLLAERALAITEAAHGPDHPEVGTQLTTSPALQDLGDLDGPGPRPSGPWPSPRPSTAPTTPPSAPGNNLGSMLRDLGDRQAQTLVERALAIPEAVYGPDHPAVGTGRNNLGSVLQDLGEPQRAKTLFERALAIPEAVYGPDHPAVGTGRNNLAQHLQDLGDLRGPGPWPSGPWPSPRPPTAPTTPPSAPTEQPRQRLRDLGDRPARPWPSGPWRYQAAYGPGHPPSRPGGTTSPPSGGPGPARKDPAADRASPGHH